MTPTETGKTAAPATIGKTPPARSNRLLSVVRSNDDRSLHLSPILQQIKDDGPALIDGEVVKDSAPKLAKPTTGADAKAAAAPLASAQPVVSGRLVKMLMGFCTAVTLALGASLYVAWQQQQRLANVEYLLETLVITTTR